MNDNNQVYKTTELANISRNFEYNKNVPLRFWVRSAFQLLKQADIYENEGSFEDSYLLLSRFSELILNKLNSHPEKETPLGRRQYEKLLLKLSDVFDRLENLKNIINQKEKKRNEELKIQHRTQLDSQLKTQKESNDKPHVKHSRIKKKSNEDIFNYIQDLSFNERFKPIDNSTIPTRVSSLKKDTESSLSYPPVYRGLSLSESPSESLSEKFTPETSLPKPLIPKKELQTKNNIKEDFKQNDNITPKIIEFPIKNLKENGEPLRTVFLPSKLRKEFLKISNDNTIKGIETCGILCGNLNRNAFFINTLVVPDQESTTNTCQTKNEEYLFEFVDTNNLIVLGWIHTHPTQTCFMSSVDLHTQNSYQLMLPESIAIVCSPTKIPDYGIFRLTDPPGVQVISNCTKKELFHPHEQSNLYTSAYNLGHVLIRDDLPFEIKDIRSS